MNLSERFDLIKKQVELESQIEDIYSNFLMTYLLSNKKKAIKITNLTLKINGFGIEINEFLEKQWTVRHGYTELIKQGKNYAKFKLTNSACLMADTFEFKQPIVRRTYLIRFLVVVFNCFRVSKRIIIKTIPTFFTKLFSKKSGTLVMKTIGVLSVILGFIWLCIEMFEWAQKKGFFK